MEINENNKPRGYRVDDDNNLEEKNLKKNFLFGDGKEKNATAPGMEGQGTGGEKFGENNLTPSGDDEANPSRYAGYGNAYFRRTEPAEEHPENSNFKNENQSGSPDYSQAQPKGNADSPEPEKKEAKNINAYQEGTADNDGETNIPGPSELPDQQKVGENNDSKDEK